MFSVRIDIYMYGGAGFRHTSTSLLLWYSQGLSGRRRHNKYDHHDNHDYLNDLNDYTNHHYHRDHDHYNHDYGYNININNDNLSNKHFDHHNHVYNIDLILHNNDGEKNIRVGVEFAFLLYNGAYSSCHVNHLAHFLRSNERFIVNDNNEHSDDNNPCAVSDRSLRFSGPASRCKEPSL
jgi:hypothetical protein